MPTRQPRPRRSAAARQRSRRGFALEMALLVMAMFSVVVLAGLTTVATMARTSGADYKASRNGYALESAGEEVMADVAGVIKDGRISEEELATLPTPVLRGFTIAHSVAAKGPPTLRPVASGPYTGLYAMQQRYEVMVEASDSAAFRSRAAITLDAQTIPVFQFAVFYQEDLEITPGPLMTIVGRVHTNRNLYVTNNVAFEGMVTAAESTFLADKGGSVGAPLVTIRNDANAATRLDFDSRMLNPRAFRRRSEQLFNSRLAAGSQSVRPLRLPIPDSVPPAELLAPRREDDDAVLREAKLAWKADWHVTVPGAVFALTDTVAMRAALCDALLQERPEGLEIPTGPACLRIFKPRVNAFVDAREGRSPDLLDIHLDSLKFWSDSAPATRSPKVLYVAFTDLPAGPRGDFPAVRLRQGRAMPNPRAATDSLGLTVATREPLYVLGDFNTVTWRPSALMADAVIVLSNPPNPAMSASVGIPAFMRCGVSGVTGWCDNQQQVARVRRARASTLNAALLVGHTPTTCDARRTGCSGPVNGGGVQNIIDFREDWLSLTHRYTGSIVSLAFRQRIVGPWGGHYFQPPVRVWAFDPRFRSPNLLPPGTPAVGTVVPTAFRLVP